jgi:hypothetical protein
LLSVCSNGSPDEGRPYEIGGDQSACTAANEYYGKIITANRLLDQDQDEVRLFFEGLLDDPDARVAEYVKTKVLTADEQQSYKNFVVPQRAD